MKPRVDGAFVFTVVLGLLVIVMLVATLSFPDQLRYTPFISGGLTLSFLIVLIAGTFFPRLLTWTETALQDLWGGGAEGQKMEQIVEAPSSWPSVLRVMAYAVGYLLAVYFLGFFLVTPVFLALYLILDAGAKPITAIVVSGALSFLMIVALLNLNVDLWTGMVPEIIPDYIGGAIRPQF